MIRFVFVKELIDHLRDHRSVFASLLLPLMAPFLVLLLFQVIENLQQEQPLELAIVGTEHAPGLVESLKAHGAKLRDPPTDPETAVRLGEHDVVLVIDSAYGERFRAGEPANLKLWVDHSRSDAQPSIQRTKRWLAEYAQSLAARRLLARGIAPELLMPLAVEEVDVATPERLAANLFMIIPMLLMLAAFVGGMNVAIDTTAGERERSSLEPLLLTPVPRHNLVLGKWLATATISSAVAIVAQAMLYGTMRFLPVEDLGLKLRFGIAESCLMMVAILPLSWFGAALQMLVATFARTFKEAQTYLGLLNLLPMAPALLLILQPSEGTGWMMAVPALAQVSVVGDILRGESIDILHLVWIGSTSLLYAALCLVCLARMLRRETIVFGRG